MPRIFISYRRADSQIISGRIYDQLEQAFGADNIFKDVDNIPPGRDFRGVLREYVAWCDVMLAIIGPDWLDIRNREGARRLDDPEDFVRLEVHSGLERDGALVIPVCVKGAAPPPADALPLALRELAFNNAVEIRNDPDFKRDMRRLIDYLRTLDAATARTPAPPATIAAFDVHQAISDFYRAYGAQDWPGASAILDDIRASGQAPRIFNVDQFTQEIAQHLAYQDAEREYQILRIMAQQDSPDRVWAAFQVFRESFPDYDPDDLATRFRPAPPPPADPIQAALERARHFNSRRNSDWEPFITTFDDLAIREISFCLVPVGSFQMGSDDGHYDHEEPVHPQTIEQPFWIARYPVTNAQWAQAVRAGAVPEPEGNTALKWYRDPALAEAPVVGVTWFMARDFARWIGVRLPTEREWEYAARGVESLRYPWGDDWDPDIPVWKQNSGGQTAPVQSRAAGQSWVGAGHLSGNVWEWTASLYQAYPYRAGNGREDDTGSRTDVRRVLRGGSWVSGSSQLFRAADRSFRIPDDSFNFDGFRCARS